MGIMVCKLKVVLCRSSSGEEADEEGLEAFHPELQKEQREREREREREIQHWFWIVEISLSSRSRIQLAPKEIETEMRHWVEL
jgi:hypothetical protein